MKSCNIVENRSQSRLLTILFSNVTPDLSSTIIFHIVDNSAGTMWVAQNYSILIFSRLRIFGCVVDFTPRGGVLTFTKTSNMTFRAFFNIYTGGAKAPQPLCCPPPPPPTEGFWPPPSNVPFCLKMSENHAEIAGNQV